MAEKSSRKLVLCGHCGEEVSKRTYYLHKRLYYDTTSQEWSEKRVFNPVGTLGHFDFDSVENGRSRSLSPEPLACGLDEEMNQGDIFYYYNYILRYS